MGHNRPGLRPASDPSCDPSTQSGSRSTGNILSTAESDPLALIAKGASALGRDLSEDQIRKLLELADLLASWAQRLNLTSHRTPESIVRRLILDALALEQQLPAADRIADLGSGAGFPGLPLAILRPEAELILVESRERRHHFQRAAIRSVGLSRVTPIHGRIELLEPIPAQGVVAQALAQPGRAVQLASRWCGPGGWIAVPGGEVAPNPETTLDVASAEIRSYDVPCGGPSRTLWLGLRQC